MSKYIPDRGQLVWLNFDPSLGNEQKGRRLALVLSPKPYNDFGLCYVIPITSKSKGYKIEVPLPPKSSINGVLLTNQLLNVDWRQRQVKFIETVQDEILDAVSKRLRVLLCL